MSKLKRPLARKIQAIGLAALFAVPALAQQTALPPRTDTNTQQPSLTRPIAPRTVGLEPGRVVRWNLRDAVIAALEKNVDIEIERENVKITQYDINAAKGVYDPFLITNINYQPSMTPNAFVFSGTAQPFIERDIINYNFGLQQFVEKGGGEYSISFQQRSSGRKHE